MISSDKESEEEEEEKDNNYLDNDLFSSKQLRKADCSDLNLTRAIGLRPEVKKAPNRIYKTVRSIKDMRARLALYLSSLYRTILS